MNELLNLKEAAQFLRISIYTVRAWTYQGRLPYVKLGSRCVYRQKDLEQLIAQNLKKRNEAPALDW